MATKPDGLPARGLSQEDLAKRIVALVKDVADAATAEAVVVESFRDQCAVRLPAEHVLAVLHRLKSDKDMAFEVLMDLTCVHWPNRPAPLGEFDVVYHLVSYSKGHRIRLKVACPDGERGVDSAYPVWEAANLMEREAYDMFGVRFQGHPDLRRILMDENFDGFPMRKEFPYRGH